MRRLLGLSCIGLTLVITGCGRFSLDNSSLDYKKTPPPTSLKFPNHIDVRQQTAMYPAPRIPKTVKEQAPNYVNKNGRRFEAPRPEPSKNGIIGRTNGISQPASAPVLIRDGNNNPLIKIEGGRESIWKAMLTSLSVANMKVTDQNDLSGVIALNLNGEVVLLRANQSGSAIIFSAHSSRGALLEPSKAEKVIERIYTNWATV